MFKQLFQNSRNGVESTSIVHCQSREEIRNNFLNNSLSSESQNSPQLQSEDESQKLATGSNIPSRSYADQQIIRNSRDWYHAQANFDSRNDLNQEDSDRTSKYSYSESPMIEHSLKKQISKDKFSSSNSYYFPVQVTNYKTLLRKQVQKSRKLQEDVHKKNVKMADMTMLIEKLKEQNELLRKLLRKQKQQSKIEEKTLNRHKSHKGMFCECNEMSPKTIINYHKKR